MSYFREISKAGVLFAFVQVISVISALIQGKIIAFYLGAEGYGMVSLLTTSTVIFQTLTMFGIPFAITREIASNSSNVDLEKNIEALFTWMVVLSIIGIIAAILLSEVVLGNSNISLTTSFRVASISIIFINLNLFIQSIFQGYRKLKLFALSSIINSLVVVVLSGIVYKVFNTAGIPYVILAVPVFTFFLNILLLGRTGIYLRLRFTLQRSLLGMIKIAFTKMLTTLLGNVTSYVIVIYLAAVSLDELGLYQAGMKISYQYIGLIFTALSIDYFPRLTSLLAENSDAKIYVNDQLNFTQLIVVPMLVILVLFVPYLIPLLFTLEFMPIANFVQITSIAMIFMAIKQPLDYFPFAMGKSKVFFSMSLFGSLSLICSTYFGYLKGGLIGISVGFVFHSIIGLVIISLIAYRLYGFIMSRSNWLELVLGLFLLLSSLLISQYTDDKNGALYLILFALAVVAIYSVKLFRLL